MTLAMGQHPRYLEQLRIGGGYSEPVNGGADFDAAGNIVTDGDVACGEVTAREGGIHGGLAGVTRGIVSAYQGAANAPGCLKLWSADGSPYYIFTSNDGQGLRISSGLPVSDMDGQLLRAQTVADLSSPPPIGGATPNEGRFSQIRTSGPAVIGSTTETADAKLHLYGGSSGFTGGRDYRIADGLLMENDADCVFELQSGPSNAARIWFGDNQRECSGWISYNNLTDSLEIGTDGASRITISQVGDIESTCDFACKGGDLFAGQQGSTRGSITAASGSGGTTPGTLRLSSPNGTFHYFFVEDDGTLKVAASAPSSNDNGKEIGEQYGSGIVTFTADDTTPDVSGSRMFKVSNEWTAGHNITMFDGGAAGQAIVVIGNDSDCVVTDGGNLLLTGDWTGSPGKTLSLLFDGTNWYETGRGNN